MKKVCIIAEAGVNHNGSIELARQLVDVAKDCDADMVKFQTFIPEFVTSKTARKAEYQNLTTNTKESQLEMLKKLSLTTKDFLALKDYAQSKKIVFLSTAFDLVSIDILSELDLPFFKIPSGEINNLPYLRKMGGLKKPLIVSTGMATVQEIEEALNILINAGTALKDITLLHCNTEYPTPYKDANLRAILTLKERFHTQVGYSDHTPDIECAIAAVALGATVVEKHFTLDKAMAGPDHTASLNPDELKRMVTSIRNIEKAMGSGEKIPSPSEAKNIEIVRRSIVAKNFIRKGEMFTEANLICKRPAIGLSPMEWDHVVGQKAHKDFEEDEPITL